MARSHGTVSVNVIDHQLDCIVYAEGKSEKRIVFVRLVCQFLLHKMRLDFSAVVVLETNQIFIRCCTVRMSFSCAINLILVSRKLHLGLCEYTLVERVDIRFVIFTLYCIPLRS